MTNTKNTDTYQPRSLLRILGIFETLARSEGGLTLAELNTILDAPKSSLLLILRPLVSHKFLIHNGGRYELGPSIFQLSAEVLANVGITKIIRPYIEELAEECSESVYLAALNKEDKTVSYVDGIDSKQTVRYSAPIGTTRPLYISSAGKVLLAFQDHTWQREYLKETKLKPLTDKPIKSKSELIKELSEIKSSGLAVSIGEAVAGASGIAAPIVKENGTASYAILIAAPSDRFVRAMPRLSQLLSKVAIKASETLSHMPGN